MARKVFAVTFSTAITVRRCQHKQDDRPHGFRNGFQIGPGELRLICRQTSCASHGALLLRRTEWYWFIS